MAKKHTIEFIRDQFEKRGYTLISTVYNGNKEKLYYLCPKHGEQSISYDNLSHGKGCKRCGVESSKEKQRFTIDYIREQFSNKGFVLISDTYEKNTDKLRYLCSVHGEMVASYADFRSGCGCEKCGVEARTGEGCGKWQGGITEITRMLRNYIADNHKEAIESSSYTCCITGIRGCYLEVHHTYAFRDILNDTLTTLNLDVRQTIGEYSEEELSEIRSVFMEIQASHESVVLSKEIHKLFHDTYGRVDFTPEQFDEFKERYDNNEFTDILSKTA